MPDDPSDEVATIARRFRKESIAALVAVTRDARAPAAARAQAATKLLEYASGRPTQAKQVTVADVATMSMDETMALLRACCDRIERQCPGLLWDVLNKAALEPGPLRRNRFSRGEPDGPRPAHIVPPRSSARDRATRAAQRNSSDAGGNARPEPSPSLKCDILPDVNSPGPKTPEDPPSNPVPLDPSNFANSDYDSADRPLHRIGYGEPLQAPAPR
jgi:hypothetical protein